MPPFFLVELDRYFRANNTCLDPLIFVLQKQGLSTPMQIRLDKILLSFALREYVYCVMLFDYNI